MKLNCLEIRLCVYRTLHSIVWFFCELNIKSETRKNSWCFEIYFFKLVEVNFVFLIGDLIDYPGWSKLPGLPSKGCNPQTWVTQGSSRRGFTSSSKLLLYPSMGLLPCLGVFLDSGGFTNPGSIWGSIKRCLHHQKLLSHFRFKLLVKLLAENFLFFEETNNDWGQKSNCFDEWMKIIK